MVTSWAYFDTSVLVKRYVREEGTSEARRLLKHYCILTSAIAPTEAISAFSRRRTLGELTAPHFAEILRKLKSDRAYWELVEVSPLVLQEADEVILKTDLRTLDALHLASILTFQAVSGIQLPIITGDIKQRQSAEQLGLNTIWVG
ncbi:MAG: ribonuclease VapC [Nitrospirales bacterium]|nr:MAG: ribonuclease VapC [Nitrospirales bacterium]